MRQWNRKTTIKSGYRSKGQGERNRNLMRIEKRGGEKKKKKKSDSYNSGRGRKSLAGNKPK